MLIRQEKRRQTCCGKRRAHTWRLHILRTCLRGMHRLRSGSAAYRRQRPHNVQHHRCHAVPTGVRQTEDRRPARHRNKQGGQEEGGHRDRPR